MGEITPMRMAVIEASCSEIAQAYPIPSNVMPGADPGISPADRAGDGRVEPGHDVGV